MDAAPKKKRRKSKGQDTNANGKTRTQPPSSAKQPSQRSLQDGGKESRTKTEEKASVKTSAVEELESLFSTARAAKRKQQSEVPMFCGPPVF